MKVDIDELIKMFTRIKLKVEMNTASQYCEGYAKAVKDIILILEKIKKL